jgi:hypothetical protein
MRDVCCEPRFDLAAARWDIERAVERRRALDDDSVDSDPRSLGRSDGEVARRAVGVVEVLLDDAPLLGGQLR